MFGYRVIDRVIMDIWQETGLGLARRAEDEAESDESEDSGDGANGTARGFFLADGTPNIRLRRYTN